MPLSRTLPAPNPAPGPLRPLKLLGSTWQQFQLLLPLSQSCPPPAIPILQLNYPPDGTDFKYLLELRAEAEYYGLVGMVAQIDKCVLKGSASPRHTSPHIISSPSARLSSPPCPPHAPT